MSARASGCRAERVSHYPAGLDSLSEPYLVGEQDASASSCNGERWSELVRQNPRAGWAHVQPSDVNSSGKAVHVGPPAAQARYTQAAFRLDRLEPVERREHGCAGLAADVDLAAVLVCDARVHPPMLAPRDHRGSRWQNLKTRRVIICAEFTIVVRIRTHVRGALKFRTMRGQASCPCAKLTVERVDPSP